MTAEQKRRLERVIHHETKDEVYWKMGGKIVWYAEHASPNQNDDYMCSSQWMRKAAEAREYHGNKCYVCDDPYVHVHHITYRNIGNERMEDLALLCRSHHRRAHKFGPKHYYGKAYSILPRQFVLDLADMAEEMGMQRNEIFHVVDKLLALGRQYKDVLKAN